MKYWVTCPADIEKYVSDERERPTKYEEHFYPCYIEYAEPWDFHFCGYYYFVNETKEQAISMRKENLKNYISKCYLDIDLAKQEIEKLKHY